MTKKHSYELKKKRTQFKTMLRLLKLESFKILDLNKNSHSAPSLKCPFNFHTNQK